MVSILGSTDTYLQDQTTNNTVEQMQTQGYDDLVNNPNQGLCLIHPTQDSINTDNSFSIKQTTNLVEQGCLDMNNRFWIYIVNVQLRYIEQTLIKLLWDKIQIEHTNELMHTDQSLKCTGCLFDTQVPLSHKCSQFATILKTFHNFPVYLEVVETLKVLIDYLAESDNFVIEQCHRILSDLTVLLDTTIIIGLIGSVQISV